MKLKYKVGTLVEVAGKGHVEIKKIAYVDHDGNCFTDEEVLSAYRPVKEKTAKTTKRTARRNKAVEQSESEAVN